jgi:hypothetical protein
MKLFVFILPDIISAVFQYSCGTADEKLEQAAIVERAGNRAEEEGEQGEEHDGEGAEVVHHLREGDVPGVEHGGPEPGVHARGPVHQPHAVHRCI